jgi:hypothetical protein
LLAITLTACMEAVSAQDTVTWAREVGIISPGATVGTGTGSVPGGGFPWVTSRGAVFVNLTSGQFQFVVQGLVLAAGNSIGTRADITRVRGTLVCDTNGSAGGNSTLVQTASVALSTTGDAVFSGNVGSVPAVCRSQQDLAFLIRVAQVNGTNVNGPWIAFGAVRRR